MQNIFFLENNNWVNKLVFWELELLKLIGYDLSLKSIVNDICCIYVFWNLIKSKVIENLLLFHIFIFILNKIIPQSFKHKRNTSNSNLKVFFINFTHLFLIKICIHQKLLN